MSVKWNPAKKREDVFKPKHPVSHINNICEIEEGVTLRDIMNLVANDKMLTTFVSLYSSVNHIEEFHEELNVKYNKKEKECDYLEVHRVGDLFENELNCWTDISGVNTKETCKYCNDEAWPDHKHYISYSYTPLYKYAMLPVKLDKRFTVRDFKKDKILLNVTQDFALIDILHAIYFDISFHGGPKDRDKFCKSLKRQVKNLDKTKTFPLDDLFKKE
jgi:hypothetical protein